MGNTFTDLSQLKKFRPAASEPPPAASESPQEEDRQLAEATSSTDYFSSLLGTPSTQRQKKPPRRVTVVTPATVVRVHAEQAEDAFAAERDALETELAEKDSVIEALAIEKVQVNESLAQAQAERAQAQAERAQAQAELAQEREKTAKVQEELARLQALLAEAQRTSLSSTVLLDKPDGLSEKFTGEIREHVLETLADAQRAADTGGRDRRARILEAILCANAGTGELARRRAAVKLIMKDAGTVIDGAAIAALEKLGFRYVSGANHHKLDFAGIRFPVAKTPSDRRSCLNSAADIFNRVF